ncbi:MAG TPA: acyltransferase [Panacibacter sp.]|nr:acyltransferase [Panacibacter sp.]
MIYRNNYSIYTKAISVVRFICLKIIFYKKLKTGTLGLVGRGFYFNIKKEGGITIGNRPVLADHSELQASGKIQIGNNLGMNRFSRIVAHEKIVIGDNVTIAQFVTILDHDHNYKFENNKLGLSGYITSPVSIGSNVWIGDKVTILKGVHIGNNVIIAANALVNDDIPGNCIAGGIPAKILKQLNE